MWYFVSKVCYYKKTVYTPKNFQLVTQNNEVEHFQVDTFEKLENYPS